MREAWQMTSPVAQLQPLCEKPYAWNRYHTRIDQSQQIVKLAVLRILVLRPWHDDCFGLLLHNDLSCDSPSPGRYRGQLRTALPLSRTNTDLEVSDSQTRTCDFFTVSRAIFDLVSP